MKILAMADLHGDLESYRRIGEVLSSADIRAVVLAGDLLTGVRTDLTIEEAQQEVAGQIAGILRSFVTPVYYIMGNDDLVELGCEEDHIHSIHGRRMSLGKFNVVGYQYSLPFVLGPFEKTEESIAKDLLEVEPLLDTSTVFVTHSPAYGILDEGIPIPGRDIHVGSKSILELIRHRHVRAHVHGHVHKCFGHSGVHFNVASAGRFRGMIIDLENLSYEMFSRDEVPNP